MLQLRDCFFPSYDKKIRPNKSQIPVDWRQTSVIQFVP